MHMHFLIFIFSSPIFLAWTSSYSVQLENYTFLGSQLFFLSFSFIFKLKYFSFPHLLTFDGFLQILFDFF